MQIIIAPQSFKGTLTAHEAAKAIQEGILKALPGAIIELVPVADGGDGTLDVLLQPMQGELKKAQVSGPFGGSIEIPWGFCPDSKTAIIELSKICGMAMLSKGKLDPANASTYGVGEAVRHALDEGCRHFVIGIGGSCTNDAGAGIAQALGAKFLDKNDRELRRGGAALKELDRIDLSGLDPRIAQSKFLIGCDVMNPLLGPTGATHVYAPQKGASPEMVIELEAALGQFAKVVKKELGMDIAEIPAGGAAGGVASGFKVFLGADLKPGIDLVLEQVQFYSKLPDADLVIIGEGRMDGQTLNYKAPLGVAKAAKEFGLPVLAIVGSLGKGYEALHGRGIDSIIPLSFFPADPQPDTYNLLVKAAEEGIRCLHIRTLLIT